jgi:hypothetical protein
VPDEGRNLGRVEVEDGSSVYRFACDTQGKTKQGGMESRAIPNVSV